MSLYVQKWNEYILSGEGEKASDPTTLQPIPEHKQFMVHRLRRAFEYGWAAGAESAKTDAMAALHKLMFETDL